MTKYPNTLWSALYLRLKMTVDRLEEEEKVMNMRLEDEQGMARKMAEENHRFGQIISWKEMKRSCGLTVNELTGMGEMARGKVEQLT